MSAAFETVEPQPTSLADLFSNLTFKQKSFADNYIEHRNGVLSARLAGYEGNDQTLGAVAYENLKKPQIVAYIKHKLEERHIGPERVLAELADVATFSLGSIAAQGSPVKTQDKLKALELVGKFHRLFQDRVDADSPSDQVSSQLVELLKVLCERARLQMDQQAQQLSEPAVIDVTPVTATATATDDDHH